MDEYQRAVENRNFAKITEIIKKYGSNAPYNYANNSVLYKASKADDVELVRTLLEAGISKHLDSGLGSTVSLIAIAIGHNNIDMVRLLVNHYDINSGDISSAIQHGNTDVLDLFIEKGVDMHALGRDGSYYGLSEYTYFNRAVLYGQTELVKRFLKEGHSVNKLNTHEDFASGRPGDTPTIYSALDYARGSANQELISLLLENGAKSRFEILHAMSREELKKMFRPENRGIAKTTINDLRFRAEPTLGAVLGYLRSGDDLYVVCRTDDKSDIDGFSDYWYYVMSSNGKRGWTYGGYIRQTAK